ncbi:MAG: cytochrome c3 family protein, partial [Nitrospirota bacterium]
MTGRGRLRYKLLLIIVILFIPVSTYSRFIGDRPHADKSKLPRGCASCHRGHGKYSTPMLPERKETFCFRCHGHSVNVEKTKREGDLAKDVKQINIQKEFEKPYHHPIEKTGIHRFGETLPEINPSMPRHADCG